MIKKLIACFILFSAITIQFVGCHIEWMPQDGAWYCEELEMQISFSPDIESFCIVDGVKIPCDCINDTSSKWFFVITQATNIEDLPVGTVLFSAERASLTESRFVVIEEQTGIEYTFERLKE